MGAHTKDIENEKEKGEKNIENQEKHQRKRKGSYNQGDSFVSFDSFVQSTHPCMIHADDEMRVYK